MSNMKKPYFPMFVDLSEKKVIVVGAGTIAKRRIRSLLTFTNHLVVIAPEINKELKELENTGQLTIRKKIISTNGGKNNLSSGTVSHFNANR